ncbi:MAG: translation initiation factor IF-2 [Methanomicrobiales archaeon]|nr:translation initiation factor IF-2 [Methanomicrobiales archaeon]
MGDEEQRTDTIRTPIVCVLGHVDHGKTSLLDRIRGSSVVANEVGAITQHIGATLVPIDAIRTMSRSMEKMPLRVPGLLFIDTPGHQAFTTLRARGGALADMAILVVDIVQGFQPQTLEALQILRNARTPFVVAATKIDRVQGWRPSRDELFATSFPLQNERVRETIEKKVYEIVGVLSEHEFSAERFDRVSDFRRNLAVVPLSAHTGEGIAELLMVMIGLAQRYMEQDLEVCVDRPGCGTVLEVKEERGLGMTLDLILYDGTLSVGDEFAVATQDGVIITKVRSLLQPRPMQEILVEDRFARVKSVVAAAGVKVSAPGLERVIPGSPLRVVRDNHEEAQKAVYEEMAQINVKISPEGLVVKADTIGALEAIARELDQKGIGVVQAKVGPVSRHDLIDAETLKDPYYRVLLAFNTPILPDAQEILKEAGPEGVRIIAGRVIYQIVDEYLAWRDERKRKEDQQKFEQIVLPAKVRVLPHCIFRQSNPAVVGVRVLGGTLRTGTILIRLDGKKVGLIKTMQYNQESIREAEAGKEVAISIEGATVGRQVNVEDDLIVEIPERHVKVLEKEMLSHLPISTQEVLREFTTLKRRESPFWGK